MPSWGAFRAEARRPWLVVEVHQEAPVLGVEGARPPDPRLGLFGWFLVQPESALSDGPALLIDNLLRARTLIAVVGAVLVVFADLQPQSRLSALARRELALMYADRVGGRTYFFGAPDDMTCRLQTPQDQGLNGSRFHGLNQYLSLTDATTVWASWPGAPPPQADPAN
jgi:hypothetical protein